LAQSYRLYTLALAGSPDLSSWIDCETKGISNESKLRLASAYVYWQTKSAGLSLLNTSIDDNSNYIITYGSVDRNRAMVWKHFIAWAKVKKAFAMATNCHKECQVTNGWEHANYVWFVCNGKVFCE
jgi:hypothetical protein